MSAWEPSTASATICRFRWEFAYAYLNKIRYLWLNIGQLKEFYYLNLVESEEIWRSARSPLRSWERDEYDTARHSEHSRRRLVHHECLYAICRLIKTLVNILIKYSLYSRCKLWRNTIHVFHNFYWNVYAYKQRPSSARRAYNERAARRRRRFDWLPQGTRTRASRAARRRRDCSRLLNAACAPLERRPAAHRSLRCVANQVINWSLTQLLIKTWPLLNNFN